MRTHFSKTGLSSLSFYALSATLNKELQQIMIVRGLLPYVRKMGGWPPDKSRLINQRIAFGGG